MQTLRVEIHECDERGNVYRLMSPLVYCYKGLMIVVPAGFESDGASVPRFFWRFVFPPGEPKALRAAFLHDYVYREQPNGWTRKMADEMFKEVMLMDGVERLDAYKSFFGVRAFGFFSWRKNGR